MKEKINPVGMVNRGFVMLSGMMMLLLNHLFKLAGTIAMHRGFILIYTGYFGKVGVIGIVA